MGSGETKRKPGRIVLLRHGRSEWNDEDRFTGWYDSPLIEEGRGQAVEAGKLLKENNFRPDVVFTTSLSRASETGKITLAELGITGGKADNITKVDDRLAERHYGALTGEKKDKVLKELIKEHGEKKGNKIFLAYRRSYLNAPPAMEDGHEYKNQIITIEGNTANTESLKNVVGRVDEFWKKELLPRLLNGKDILISAHGNSMRALSKIINGIDDEAIKTYELDNAKPIVFDITPSQDLKSWKVVEQKFSSEDKLQALLDQISTKDGGKGYAKIKGELNYSKEFNNYQAANDPKEVNKFYKTEIEVTYAKTVKEDKVKFRNDNVVSAVALIKNLHEQGLITGKLPDDFKAETLSASLEDPSEESHKCHYRLHPIAIGENAQILINPSGHVVLNIKVTGEAAYTKNVDEKLDKALNVEKARKAGANLEEITLQPEKSRARA